jgi:hypothetical protein
MTFAFGIKDPFDVTIQRSKLLPAGQTNPPGANRRLHSCVIVET